MLNYKVVQTIMMKLPKSLHILLGYIKIILLFKTHFKIALILFYFITILAPKFEKNLQFLKIKIIMI